MKKYFVVKMTPMLCLIHQYVAKQVIRSHSAIDRGGLHDKQREGAWKHLPAKHPQPLQLWISPTACQVKKSEQGFSAANAKHKILQVQVQC